MKVHICYPRFVGRLPGVWGKLDARDNEYQVMGRILEAMNLNISETQRDRLIARGASVLRDYQRQYDKAHGLVRGNFGTMI